MKFAHQWSCGCALYCSHWCIETPPTTMIHSPCGTFAAAVEIFCENAIATTPINGRNRFVMVRGEHYLCARRPAQLPGLRLEQIWETGSRELAARSPNRIDLVATKVLQRLAFA